MNSLYQQGQGSKMVFLVTQHRAIVVLVHYYKALSWQFLWLAWKYEQKYIFLESFLRSSLIVDQPQVWKNSLSIGSRFQVKHYSPLIRGQHSQANQQSSLECFRCPDVTSCSRVTLLLYHLYSKRIVRPWYAQTFDSLLMMVFLL